MTTVSPNDPPVFSKPKTGPGVTEPMEPVHQHHWRNLKDEQDGAKFGMWMFLATEVLLFSGFFCAYAAYRMWFPDNWHDASRTYLDWKIGTANTFVLLLSSFTVVMAIRQAQLGSRFWCLFNLAITQLCAIFFLVVKIGWEYLPKIEKGKLPGGLFSYDHPVGDYDATFMGIYWVSTATHGLHVLIGIGVFFWIMWKAWKWEYGPKNVTSLENAGLYWHIVDIIWIFLFPLLYLV